MAIPTTRTKTEAEIFISEEKCNNCGLCVTVCKDFGLILENGKAHVSEKPIFGCIGCGHCMAVCPTGAIEIRGREISANDIFDLPKRESAGNYDQINSLFQRRRSIREFKDTPVSWEIIQKILKAAETAPMGLPPSDVNILVFDTKEKVRAFSIDFCEYINGMKWLISDFALMLMRPFWGKTYDEIFRNFVKPMIKTFNKNMKEGIDLVTYDAPLSIYFYGSPYTDPADPIVAATYAMIAAESLGLGTCMIGSIHPMIQMGKSASHFRDAHNIKYASREGIFVVFGYPDVKYTKGIRRSFASITIDTNR